ncbi:MAG: DUF3604 domain-containing protein [Candidatus Binatia bacterium]|nr:DUF3604 domain-containing protein [Candidatus Binatia bacterium]
MRCLALIFAVLAAATSAAAFERTEEREPCADFDPMKRPFFGDTHVHTSLSFDAAGQGTRNDPRDAYRFARGEAIGIQPYDENGKPKELVQLRRPLDFAMVSDHSDLLGETQMCKSSGLPGYDSWICTVFRRWPLLGYALINSRYAMERPTRMSFCGPDARDCLAQARGPWRTIQDAAEEAYDRTSRCEFTTFVGYEWTGMPGMANIHRNVVFRNERVQEAPTTFVEHPTAEQLWTKLETECLDGSDGCDVLAIPHNSNVSKGRMFLVETDAGEPIGRADAERRSRIETLVEVTQHKGDSECRVDGLSRDELCGYEKLSYASLGGEALPNSSPAIPPRVYTREALTEGLVQHAKIGANPFRLGLIGATDTHFGTPGLVAEDQFPGHAAGTVTRRMEIPALPDSPNYNPGGLAVLWAEENSRDSLFSAMRRKEAYGTTGPRIVTRFFGGWDFPDDICNAPDLVARGYAQGVPMGGDLPSPPPNGARPRFVVAGWQDAGTEKLAGTPLERLQIIKAWVDGGVPHEEVYDVARAPGGPGTVDLATCELDGGGADSLCTVWEDADFDPGEHALYYVRVLESPSCRWLQFACNAKGVDCTDASTVRNGLEPCCDPDAAKVLQERAWTSPIWYTPPA